jgi:polyisoprenoid-binding protein YceI
MIQATLKLGAALLASVVLVGFEANAAPITYQVDPMHTYPSFEADHMGLSYWRGKINKNSGTVVLDKSAGVGSVDITIELSSIDFGLEPMNAWAKGKDFFNVKASPKAKYKGSLANFVDGNPTQLNGELTLNGRTQPVNLNINRFKCMPHPLHKRELCGADASGSFKRDAFGLDTGKDYGFNMDVSLRIQVEAVAPK